MAYEKIHAVIHVGKNLLIVGYNQTEKWQFRVVTQKGEIVQEVNNFTNPNEAEKTGTDWIKKNL